MFEELYGEPFEYIRYLRKQQMTQIRALDMLIGFHNTMFIVLHIFCLRRGLRCWYQWKGFVPVNAHTLITYHTLQSTQHSLTSKSKSGSITSLDWRTGEHVKNGDYSFLQRWNLASLPRPSSQEWRSLVPTAVQLRSWIGKRGLWPLLEPRKLKGGFSTTYSSGVYGTES